ncbi:MAG: hypothetical protein ACLQVK_17610 [Acidimicrobiales bacterium]
MTCDNGGSDTDDEYPPDTAVWTRQHPAIWIDEGVDGISDDGPKIASYLIANKRQVVLMVGVHANLCVLDRSFGLPALVGFGLQPVLVSDLTDTMYDPATAPYVSHETGTELVIGYIEAFIAPTTRSDAVKVIPEN